MIAQMCNSGPLTALLMICLTVAVCAGLWAMVRIALIKYGGSR